MNLYPPPSCVDRGWARALYRGPRTVAEILEDAAAEGDPLAVARLARKRRRRAFWHRLLRR